MSCVDVDFKMTEKLLNNVSVDGYGKIYFSSNEDLKTIFSNFDFKDKDVLTVAGSGDQAFYFYNDDAKKVDLFDKNKLTIYYYYLRKWIISYYDMFYPELLVNNQYFINLFNAVKPSCEMEKAALAYWNNYFIYYDYGYCFDMFNFSSRNIMKSNKLEDLFKVKKRLNNSLSTFYHTDISKESIIKKQYDVIYTSNISEWLHSSNEKFEGFRDNLYDLLNDNGIVIMSNYGKYGASYHELDIFRKKFEYMELPKVKFLSRHYEESPGYVYTKK